jgi:hypothetical protein
MKNVYKSLAKQKKYKNCIAIEIQQSNTLFCVTFKGIPPQNLFSFLTIHKTLQIFQNPKLSALYFSKRIYASSINCQILKQNALVQEFSLYDSATLKLSL